MVKNAFPISNVLRVSSNETDINTQLAKAWTTIDRLSFIWKSDLTEKMKRSFFQTAVVSILIYGCTPWTFTKCMEKAWRQQDKNAASNIEHVFRQHPTKQRLYGHLPPTMKTIKIKRTRHAGHSWRSKDNLVSDVLLWWTPSHGWAKAGRPARTYIQQLCADTGCSPEDLREAMDDS